MDTFLPDNIEFYINESFTAIRESIVLQNGIFCLILGLFIVAFIIKIILFRKDKELLRDNIINLIGIILPYVFVSSITLIFTESYHSGIKISTILNTYSLCYLIGVGFLYLVYYEIKTNIKYFLK